MSIVKLNNNGVKNATAFGSITGLGSMTFIKKLTASSSSTLSCVDGASGVVLDNTYKEYVFTFKDIHPQASDEANFSFQGNAAGGSGYNETITSTYFTAQHNEADTAAALAYVTGQDQANGTAFQPLAHSVGGGNDECLGGYLHLFNPSSTTFVKHFISRISAYNADDGEMDAYVAGYFNTTSAIDEIQFKFHTNNIQSGDICLYGIA